MQSNGGGYTSTSQDVPRASITDEVAARLENLITENQMQVGDALPSEQALSQMFRVSTRVVREGLRSLAAQGIVRTSQGKRAVVAEASPVAIEAYFRFVERMDRKSVLELYELREVIEVRAAALAAQRATAADVERAQRVLEDMAGAGDDVAAYVAGDIAFHAAIVDAAHNRFLSAVMTALAGALHAERELGVRNRMRAGRRPSAIDEHRAVLRAVEARDPDAAKRAIVAHMASGRTDVRQYLSNELEATESAPGQDREPAGEQ